MHLKNNHPRRFELEHVILARGSTACHISLITVINICYVLFVLLSFPSLGNFSYQMNNDIDPTQFNFRVFIHEKSKEIF